MSAFGKRPEEPMFTDQIDDDYDVVNDETFGGEVPNDEWEIDQIAEESEANDVAANLGAFGNDILSFAASKLPISDDPLDFLEQSISHLVDVDDDVPFASGRKLSNNTKHLTDIFAPGSPQTPFFQLNQANSIWSESPSLTRNTAPATVSGLLDRMQLKESNDIFRHAEPTPILVKGAKTAEELEAEMLGKPAPAPSLPKLAGQKLAMKSCEELEQELIESSKTAAASMAKSDAAPGAGMPIPPGMPPLPQFPPHMLMRPPIHPSWLANPQVRAAVMARFFAANPAMAQQVRFRMPPPPMMPPPAGFRPPVVISGRNMPPNFPNVMRGQNVDPRFIGFTLQQAGIRKDSPNFPKRRLFGSPGRNESRDDSIERGRNHRDYNRDPFAGLMTRRERSWLIKIQSLQLHSESPYVDDYYWIMYRHRKHASDKNAPMCKDSDHNDNFEHRVYVPPSFEGTLGKVQVLSANFPRQVLDLTAANGENAQTADEESPRDSPPPSKTGQSFSGRRLKNVLMEIENLYLLILEVADLTAAIQDSNSSAGAADKDAAVARVQQHVQTIVSTLSTDDHIANAIGVRKGRRLLLQLMSYCGKENALILMQSILRNLPSISKKEPHLEILNVIQTILDKVTGLEGSTDWSAAWEAIRVDTIEITQKQKLTNLLMIRLVQRSAKDGAVLTEGAAKVVERWTNSFYATISGSNTDVKYGLLEKPQADMVSTWLKSLPGVSIPPLVIETIESHLTK